MNRFILNTELGAKRIVSCLLLLASCLLIFAQETPNAKQARRLFYETYNMVYGPKGSRLHYAVNIIGLYKTEGTIWTKQKKSKSIDGKYIIWNDDKDFFRLDKKANTVTVYDAHSDERDKLAAKFKFDPENYHYSIKEEKQGYAIFLRPKKGVKGFKEARVLIDKKTHHPISVRIKVAIFHTTIKISNVQVGGITDDLFRFPKEEYPNCTIIDKR